MDNFYFLYVALCFDLIEYGHVIIKKIGTAVQ